MKLFHSVLEIGSAQTRNVAETLLQSLQSRRGLLEGGVVNAHVLHRIEHREAVGKSPLRLHDALEYVHSGAHGLRKMKEKNEKK